MDNTDLFQPIGDSYQRQVNRGLVRDWWRRITGAPTDLAKFEAVARRVNARQRLARRLQEVPLDHIVGSVGRAPDFTREFLPRPHVNPERWSLLDLAVKQGVGLPPIELLKIGEVYFVEDGNHRTSVARANDFQTIEAYVTEVASAVYLTVADFQRNRRQNKAEHPAIEVDDETTKGERSTVDYEMRYEWAKVLMDERLKETESERLAQRALGSRPRLKDHLWLYLGGITIGFGHWLKASAAARPYATPWR